MTNGKFVLGLMASCAAFLFQASELSAQVPLRVTHTHNGTVTMKYVPVNMRGKVSYSVQIPSEQTVAFVPQGQGPYDVHCYINREDSFQQKVSVRGGVDLAKLAMSGEVYELVLTFAKKRQPDGRNLRQTMSAMVIDSQGNSFQLFEAPEEASEFLDGVLGQKYDTHFVVDDQSVPARVDLRNLTFQTADFRGRFHHMAVVEDEAGCYVDGRWSAADGRQQGDVHFTVSVNSPQRIEGFYTRDGNPQRHTWSSR